MIEKALEYAEHLPIFPLIPNNKEPLTTNGFNNATQDIEQIKRWWTKTPDANIGAVSALSGYIVLDLDTPDDTPEHKLPNGAYTLSDLGIWEELNAIENVQFYKTPSGGLHYWFRTDSELLLEKRHTGSDALWDNVELLGGGGYSIIPPSSTATGQYLGDLELDRVPNIPEWLQSILENRIKEKDKTVHPKMFKYRGKNYTGNLLDKIVNGAVDGERNVWLTSITGSLLNTGMNAEAVYKFLHDINQLYIQPPLPARTVDTIFNSIGKKYLNSQKRGGKK